MQLFLKVQKTLWADSEGVGGSTLTSWVSGSRYPSLHLFANDDFWGAPSHRGASSQNGVVNECRGDLILEGYIGIGTEWCVLQLHRSKKPPAHDMMSCFLVVHV